MPNFVTQAFTKHITITTNINITILRNFSNTDGTKDCVESVYLCAHNLLLSIYKIYEFKN